MAPSPIPAPLPVWAKVALQLAPFAIGFLQDQLTYSDDSTDELDYEWRKLMVRIADTNSANAADDVFCTFDLVNITSGNVDKTWSNTDYTTCETIFDTFWTTLKPKIPAGLTVQEYRWYRRRFNPYSESKPFADMGPPERVTAKSIAGTAATRQAAQVAVSLTEKTAWPKHWGRTYLPCQLPSDLSGAGRLSSAAVDLIAGAANTAYAALGTAEFFPVVPVTQVAKDPSRHLLGVTQVQVDDIPDIVRRRRLRDVGYRKVLP